MNMNPSDELRKLHATYCRLTGLEIRFGFECESLWFSWHREGYTEDDLKVTIAYIQRLYCNQPRILAPCLRLHKLIGDLLNYAEMSAEARKIVRVKEEHTAKDLILKATHRLVETPKDAVPVADVLKSEAFRKFVEMKKTL